MSINISEVQASIANAIAGCETSYQVDMRLSRNGWDAERVWAPADLVMVYVKGYTFAIGSHGDIALPRPCDLVAHGFVIGQWN